VDCINYLEIIHGVDRRETGPVAMIGASGNVPDTAPFPPCSYDGFWGVRAF